MTPTSGSRRATLLDTSAAIALLTPDHPRHEETFAVLAPRRLGLAGHAAFETFSVLTRLPPPARVSPATAHRLIATNFPHTRFLSAEGAARVLDSLPHWRISGGSVYDALVGSAAVEHGLPLATRDRGAVDVYRDLGVSFELLD